MAGQDAAPESSLVQMSATDLVRRLATGELSAREVAEAHIARIEAVNPKLRAVVVTRFDDVLRAADEADARRAAGEPLGPLHGLPITVKASFDVAGLPTSLGLIRQANARAAADAPTVARLRRAGAIILGKTNLPQVAMANECENPLYGRTVHPLSDLRAPGGSSGGEAAIIAAYGSPLGLGSDIGGSLRLPAHACGIASLKPTSGRLTMQGHAEVFPGMEAIQCQPGPLARHVADLVLAMRVLTAPDNAPGDLTAPVPWRDSDEDVAFNGLRVAYYLDNGLFCPSPAIRRAVREAVNALEQRGAEVIPWQPPDVAEAFGLFIGILFADNLRYIRELLYAEPVWTPLWPYLALAQLPNWTRDWLARLADLTGQRATARLLRAARERSAEGYWRLVEARARYRERFLERLDEQRCAVILCPADGLPALTHGASASVAEAASYTALYNLLGLPAGVVPWTTVGPAEESDRPDTLDLSQRTARDVERGSAGLPVGVQVVARHWREDLVSRVMQALEDERTRSRVLPEQRNG
ncbi:MAG: amidase [Chloracidobacterium sp. CP2_5A]|nr:MAG: amidase [Chloracidobacterium sp. CP2_5A]